jgi:hypothetical protein
MDEEFEFHFNIYDESNVNRPRAEWPHGDNAICKWVDGRRSRKAGSAQFSRIRISRAWACLATNMLE